MGQSPYRQLRRGSHRCLKIVRDLAVGPGELELGDGSVGSGIGRELDRDTGALTAVSLGVAALEFGHSWVGTTSDRRIVDGETAVVDDGSGTKGQGGLSRGKQHSCASDNVLELHLDCWLVEVPVV